MQTLSDPRTHGTLNRLHGEARADLPRIAAGFARSLGRGLEPHHMKDAYIAINRDQGRLLYSLARMRGATNIVEFGTSFGISAIYLGAAARETGGAVVTTEIEPNKIEVARRNIAQAGLSDVVTVRGGDARETLAEHPGPIDFLFFDGWSDLYDELLSMLRPRLSAGTPLVLDNANMPGTRAFIERLEQDAQFVCSPVQAGRRSWAKGSMAIALYLGLGR